MHVVDDLPLPTGSGQQMSSAARNVKSRAAWSPSKRP
jgi:hypothetical protein